MIKLVLARGNRHFYLYFIFQHLANFVPFKITSMPIVHYVLEANFTENLFITFPFKYFYSFRIIINQSHF
ncbi:hypothetical protein Scep_021502 [Stephania cephalantha]|uniref:Uncharacterized protein n=1 Tax=Stephania cephalantha TaxID=152367 RepID=A0AAP0F8L4_9MAGN